MNKQPLLSVCIPTYGRDKILARTLSHLTSLPVFTQSGEWEIVLSDNASPDDTQGVGLSFARRFPGRIRYFRNERNVLDDNFRLALSRGCGLYLKLCNDTLLLTDEGIRAMLACIREHLSDKPNLYFQNLDSEAPALMCATMDAFVEAVGYRCTWIAEYGIWQEDFRTIDDFGRASGKMLIQVDATYRMLARKPRTIVLRRHFFDILPKPFHGGFEPSFVFGQNYFSIQRPYADAGLITRRTLNRDKYGMFRHVILPNYLITRPEFRYPRTDYMRNLWPEYKGRWYFYFFYPFTLLAIPVAWIRRAAWDMRLRMRAEKAIIP